MCRGCFNQLFLRDEFHAGGVAGLLGQAVGIQTRRTFLACSAVAAGAAAPTFGAESGADLIFRGGTIRPLPGAPVASALAVKDREHLHLEGRWLAHRTAEENKYRSCIRKYSFRWSFNSFVKETCELVHNVSRWRPVALAGG